MATESAVGWGSLKRQSLGSESGKDLTAHSWLSGVDPPQGQDCLLGSCLALLPTPHSLRFPPCLDNSMYYFPSSQFLPFLPFFFFKDTSCLASDHCSMLGPPRQQNRLLKKKRRHCISEASSLDLVHFRKCCGRRFSERIPPPEWFSRTRRHIWMSGSLACRWHDLKNKL